MSGSLAPDTSFYPRPAQPAPVQTNPLGNILNDPIGAIGGIARAQNEMNQNALFQQQFAARKALGPIYQQAIDPATGNFDINKFIVGVSAHPETAFMAGDVINQAVQRGLTQAQTVNQQLDAQQKSSDQIAQAIAGVLAKTNPLNPHVDPNDVLQTVSTMAARGNFPGGQQEALKFLQNLPQDPGQLTSLLQSLAYGHKAAVDSIAAVRGNPILANVGGQQKIVFPNTGGNAQPQVGTSLTNTPTPEQLNTLVPGHNAAGTPTVTPRQSVAPMLDGDGNIILGSGPPAPTGQPPAGTAMGPPAQAQQYLEGKGDIAEKYEPALHDASQSAQLMQQTLQHQYDLIFNPDGTPKAPVGPGSAGYTAIADMVQAAGGSPDTANKIAGGDISARQQFMKLAIGNAFQQVHQWLVGTAGRMAVSEFEQTLENGTPNPNMRPEAIKGMMQFMSDVAQQKITEQQAFKDFIQDGQQNGWKHGTPNAWPAIWSDIMQKSGIVHKIETEGRAALKGFLVPKQQ